MITNRPGLLSERLAYVDDFYGKKKRTRTTKVKRAKFTKRSINSLITCLLNQK